jgi:two-component system, OmpR family, sensor histidine kinase CpxA
MRSLFVKIFLWFWAAVALMILGVAGVQSLSWWTGPLRVPARNSFAMYAVLAVDAFERDGVQGLDGFIEQLRRNVGVNSHLLDARGVALGTTATPREVLDAGRTALTTHRPEFRTTQSLPVIARPVQGVRGDAYVFVTEVRKTPPPVLHIFRGNLWLLLLVSVLTAGLVCYALARHLTSPMVRLRAATRRLATGDLSARVGSSGPGGDELADLGHDFDRMAERLEEVVGSQRRLLRDISHELRSPLARMNVALGIARQRSRAPDDVLDRIELEAERLNALIGQLLTLSRFEAGEAAMERESVNLAALVRGVVDDADFEARALHREVRVVRCDECMLEGQGALLESAVENVVRNAVRHSPERRAVEVSLEHNSSAPRPHAAVRVRDFGPGVPEAELPRLFRPFHRVGDARDRQSGGTGLGLAITERAVRLHGGTVDARNAPGGGLIVELWFPLAQGEPDAGSGIRATANAG